MKTIDQQALWALHRARQGFVKARTAQANQIRGLLSEYGLVIPQGIGQLAKRVPALIDDASHELPGMFRVLVARLMEHVKALDEQVAQLEAQIKGRHRDNEASRKLVRIPGIGPLTASALVASMGAAQSFDNARQLAAWLGLVPRQRSSGGRPTLLGISKRGDSYLRTLLIHQARALIRAAQPQPARGGGLHELLKRRNPNVAAVALANSNARIAWALLAHERQFEANYAAVPA